MPPQTGSLNSLIQERQRAAFTGRTRELDAYRSFLGRDPVDPGYAVVFSIHGPSGVGKSWLLRRLQEFTQQEEIQAPWVDQTDRDVVEVMRHIALELDAKRKFKKYLASDKRYQQLKSEISNDPNAPEGLLSFLALGTVKGATLAARETIPGANVALEFLPEERITEGASGYLTYLARKARSADSVKLLRRPIDVLTPLFLEGLHNWSRDRKSAVVHIDTYERLRPYIDAWLRGVLEGRHGDPPVGIRFAIAGQDPLSVRDWISFGALVERHALGVFSVEEGTAYLRARGITDEKVRQRQLDKFGRLPLALAMLGSGDAEHDLDSGSLAEAYVGSISDPPLRALVLRCSLARILNQDIVGRLSPAGSADAAAQWEWLRRQSFVEQRRDGWMYHDAARNALSELQRIESPETFGQTHSAMAQHYEGKLRALPQRSNAALTIAGRRALLELIYHGLCFNFANHLDRTMIVFSDVVFDDFAFAYQIAIAVTDAHLNADAQSMLDPADLRTVADPDLTLPTSLPALTRLLALDELPPRARRRLLNIRCDWLEDLYYFELALADADAAESLGPTTDLLRLNQAHLLVALARYDEARLKLDAIEEIHDKHLHADALSLRARVADAVDGPDQALADWRAALALTPDTDTALMNYGMALLRAARPDDAVEFFERARTAGSANQSLAIARIAECYRRIGDPDRGLALLEGQLREHPDDATLWSFYADQLTHASPSRDVVVERLLSIDCRGQFEASFTQALSVARVRPPLGVTLLQRALSGRTPAAMERNQLGLALNAAGMHESAFNEFGKALESDPNSLFFLYNRGVAAKLRWGSDYRGPEIDALHRAIDAPYELAYVALYAKAGIAAASKMREEAVELLTTLAKLRRAALEWIDGDVAWADYRDDPRVTTLIGDLLLVGEMPLQDE
ncbi:MAG TPA: hypothetical protein VFY45_20520 [Baekduia sp.]|nr:hypothetical protein [Baekduia sp.]